MGFGYMNIYRLAEKQKLSSHNQYHLLYDDHPIKEFIAVDFAPHFILLFRDSFETMSQHSCGA